MAAFVGRRPRLRFGIAPFTVLVGVALLMSPAHARAAGGPVNVTMNIPADLRENPCTMAPDTVNVSGTLHIVYYVRGDGSGGYHVNETTDERAKGQSLVTSVNYLLSET